MQNSTSCKFKTQHARDLFFLAMLVEYLIEKQDTDTLLKIDAPLKKMINEAKQNVLLLFPLEQIPKILNKEK